MLLSTTKDKIKTFLTTDDKEYLVTITGEVFCQMNGSRLKLLNTDNTYLIEGEKLKLANLINFAFKGNMTLAWEELKTREVLFVDGNPNNLTTRNMYWSNNNSTEDVDGFRLIPGYSRYRINREGVVRNIVLGIEMSSYVDKYGYIFFGLTPDVGKRVPIGLHRLMAFSFLPIPANFYRLDVNHINGIKKDNNFDNLEWCTRKHNNQHARKLGLNTDNLVVYVRDVTTGAVTEYYSIASCEDSLGLGKNTVNLRVGSKGQITYPDYRQYCLKKDFTEWGQPDLERDLFRSGVAQAIKLTIKETGETRLFDSMTSLSDYLGIKKGTLSFRLNRTPPRWEDDSYIFEKSLSVVTPRP